MPVDTLMQFEGGQRRERAVLVIQRRAIGIAVRAIGTTISADVAGNGTTGAWEVAAAAPARRTVTLESIAKGIVAVVPGVVLAGRNQRAELEAVEDRRFIPDSVLHSPIELGAVVSTGVAHDRIVVAERSRERIHRRRALLVRRVRFAGLECAPWPLQPQEAVAGPQRRALGRGRCDIDLGFELGHDCHAVPTIRCKVVPDPNSKTGNIARDSKLRALIE